MGRFDEPGSATAARMLHPRDSSMWEEFKRVGEDLHSIRAAVEQHQVALRRQEDLLRSVLDRRIAAAVPSSARVAEVAAGGPASPPPLVVINENKGDVGRDPPGLDLLPWVSSGTQDSSDPSGLLQFIDDMAMQGSRAMTRLGVAKKQRDRSIADMPKDVLGPPAVDLEEVSTSKGVGIKSCDISEMGDMLKASDAGAVAPTKHASVFTASTEETIGRTTGRKTTVQIANCGEVTTMSEHLARIEVAPGRAAARRGDHDPEKAAEVKMIRTHRFLDMSALDEHHIDEPEYDVANFYHHHGFAQRVARNEHFGNIALLMIGLNAIYIGIDAQFNTEDNPFRAALYFQVAEQVFCVFFLLEWLVRFMAFKRKSDCMKDTWFKFDTVLVALMLMETWGLMIVCAILDSTAGGGNSSVSVGPLRLVRMLRLARMTRLMRALPELLTMIKGMRVAARAVLSSLLMLFGMIYVFGIALFCFLGSEEAVKEYFSSVPMAMFTLAMDGTFMTDTGDVMRSLIELRSWHTVAIFCVFILISHMTLMNMLIGVLCEVVTAVAKAEKELNAVQMVKQTLLVMLKDLDEDGDDQITCNEIARVIDDPSSMRVLRELKVDVTYLLEMLAMAFRDPDASLSIKAVMEMIMACRGDRTTTLQDLVDSLNLIRYQLLEEMSTMEDRVLKTLRADPSSEKARRHVSQSQSHSVVFSQLLASMSKRASAVQADTRTDLE